MGMFAVKNNKDEWLSFDPSHESLWHTNNPTFFKDKIYAEAQRMGRKAHVVELVEKPTPVVVSEEEAKMLKRVNSRVEYPAEIIHRYVYDSHNFSEWDYDREIRLMRACVIGCTVKKQKRYLLPMPDGTSDELDQGKYVVIRETGGIWHGSEHRHDITKQAELEYFFVTQSDIDTAPDLVKAITPVEVTDDDD